MISREQRKKILFFGDGVTMTHFVRPVALAETLDPAEWDVYFWTPKRYHSLVRHTFFRLGDLATMDPNVFLEAHAHGRMVCPEKTLIRYVHDDLEIIREIKPDLVIGDHRYSLVISAPLAGVPFASIINAHWSPYAKPPAVIPQLPVTQWVPPGLMNIIFRLIRPAIFALHAKVYNDVRRSFGLSTYSRNLRCIYTAGNLALFPDIPEFVPLSYLPAHHHFVGICSWSSPSQRPVWWDEVMSSHRPKIFVSLGSSGVLKVVRAVLEAASSLPVEVVLATSGRSVGPIPSNVHVAELLPYEETARQSAVVVSHGGTGGLYPTLAAGTPMLAIPSNIDNHLSTNLLEKGGAGIGIRVEYASPRKLRRALESLLSETRFREAARKWAGVIARHDTKTIFPELLRRWFAQRDSIGLR